MNFLPYLYLYVIIIILFYSEKSLYYFGISSRISVKICIFYVFFVVTTLFICCRAYIGADWYYYKPFFDKAPSILDNSELIRHFMEKSEWGKGYTFFNIVCKSISDNYLFLQFSSGLIDLILLHFIFSRYCPRCYLLSWGLFFAINGFGFEILYLRNTKSIYLFLLSLKYLNNKRWRYFLINFIGFLFHTSAILYFPLYFFLQNNKVEKRRIIYLLFYIVGIFFFFLKIQWVKAFIGFFLSFIPGTAGVRIGMYLRASQWAADYSFSLGMVERLISFLIVYKYHAQLSRMGLGYFTKLFYLYVFIYLFCAEFAIVIARVTALFIPAYWILFPSLYSIFRKQGKIVFLLFFLTYCALKIVISMSVNWAFYESFLFSYCSPMLRQQLYF